jgi:hypothetical protein
LRPARKYRRYIRRLEVEFSADNQHYRGISSNLSLCGIFIRTNHAFSPDTIIHLTIHLPDGTTSAVKGRVRMALRTSVVSLKNGMGIEIIEHDSHYVNFVSSLSSDNTGNSPREALTRETGPAHAETAVSETPLRDFLIVSCPMCGVRNKVNRLKISRSLRCGKCGALLTIDP